MHAVYERVGTLPAIYLPCYVYDRYDAVHYLFIYFILFKGKTIDKIDILRLLIIS